MKFLKILFFILVVSPAVSYSQYFRAGITAGISAAQYDGDGYSGYNKLGITAGAFIKRNFTDNWVAQFEIIYIQKGSIHNPDPANGDLHHFSLKLDYIEIPLLLKYSYKNFAFESGPGFGVLVRSYESIDYLAVSDLKFFNKSEISFNAGISYLIMENLEFNVRYSYSLFPIRSDLSKVNYLAIQGLSNNNVIAFTLKYTFGRKNQMPE